MWCSNKQNQTISNGAEISWGSQVEWINKNCSTRQQVKLLPSVLRDRVFQMSCSQFAHWTDSECRGSLRPWWWPENRLGSKVQRVATTIEATSKTQRLWNLEWSQTQKLQIPLPGLSAWRQFSSPEPAQSRRVNFLPLCLNHISLTQQTLPHPQSGYLQDAGDQCPSGSDGLAWGPRPQAAPASDPLWMPASPSLLRCLCSAPSWKTIYLFMDCPSRPGTALCQLNGMVIQSPNGNCSAHGISVIMSHADKKNTAFRSTGEMCVLTTNRVTGHHLLFLHHSPPLRITPPQIHPPWEEGPRGNSKWELDS